jgi:hypothetical protein
LKSEDILKHRDTENTEKERGKRGEVEGGFIARVGSLVRRITVQEIRDALGALGEARVSVESPVLFVFGRLARS